MQYLGYTYIKYVFVVFQIFKFKPSIFYWPTQLIKMIETHKDLRDA